MVPPARKSFRCRWYSVVAQVTKAAWQMISRENHVVDMRQAIHSREVLLRLGGKRLIRGD